MQIRDLARRVERGDADAAAEWRRQRPLAEAWVIFGCPKAADEIAHAGDLALRRAALRRRLVRLQTASSGGPDHYVVVGGSPRGDYGPQVGRLAPPETGGYEIICELLGPPVGREAWNNGLRAGAETAWIIPGGMTVQAIHEALIAKGFTCARWG